MSDKPETGENTLKPARKSSNQLPTTLFHQMHVSLHAFQFGSCEVQINDVPGLLLYRTEQKVYLLRWVY